MFCCPAPIAGLVPPVRVVFSTSARRPGALGCPGPVVSGPAVIVCGQNEVLGDECPTCGGWLSCVQRGGYEGPHGWRFCSVECIDYQVEHEAKLEVQRHLTVRDLLCECLACAGAGLPTHAMRDEYASVTRPGAR